MPSCPDEGGGTYFLAHEAGQTLCCNPIRLPASVERCLPTEARPQQGRNCFLLLHSRLFRPFLRLALRPFGLLNFLTAFLRFYYLGNRLFCRLAWFRQSAVAASAFLSNVAPAQAYPLLTSSGYGAGEFGRCRDRFKRSNGAGVTIPETGVSTNFGLGFDDRRLDNPATRLNDRFFNDFCLAAEYRSSTTVVTTSCPGFNNFFPGVLTTGTSTTSCTVFQQRVFRKSLPPSGGRARADPFEDESMGLPLILTEFRGSSQWRR